MLDQTILAAVPASVLRHAVALGWDRDALAREAGVDLARLEDPDARVPVAFDLGLWTVISARPIGLVVGERLGVETLGVVGYAMTHGSTVGEALALLQRWRAVVHPGLVPDVEHRHGPAGALVVFTKPVPEPFARLREPVYAQAAGTVATMRALAGLPELRARFVTFPLPRPASPERIEAYFGCPVSWDAPLFEIAFDEALLARALPRSDARLRDYLAQRADTLLAALPATDESATGRARAEIVALMPHGEPRIGAVARRMAMSERTLHRRLAEEGRKFSDLVDDVRRERAERLLRETTLSASEVAFLLGYGEPAAFFRAFRRWHDTTPQRWRAGAGRGA